MPVQAEIASNKVQLREVVLLQIVEEVVIEDLLEPAGNPVNRTRLSGVALHLIVEEVAIVDLKEPAGKRGNRGQPPGGVLHLEPEPALKAPGRDRQMNAVPQCVTGIRVRALDKPLLLRVVGHQVPNA